MIENVVPVSGVPIFRYYGFTPNPATPDLLQTTPLDTNPTSAAANASNKTVKVAISFVARPTRAPSASLTDSTFQNYVYVRTADPTDPDHSPDAPDRPHPTRLAAPRACTREDGFTMIALMGALLVTTLLVGAAFAAVDNDQPTSRANADSKAAYAAAEAGVNDYPYHLTQDQAYWSLCTNVPSPNAVNQKWNGAGTDPRTWRSVPGSSARYTIELLPNPNVSSCDSQHRRGASMIDPTRDVSHSGHRRRRRDPPVKRGIMVTFKRKGFLDYLYFTNYETSDPAWYTLDLRLHCPDLVTWANTTCARYYRRDGLHPNAYRDQELYDYGPGSPTNNPNEGAFYNGQLDPLDRAARRSSSPPPTSWPARCTPTTSCSRADRRPSAAPPPIASRSRRRRTTPGAPTSRAGAVRPGAAPTTPTSRGH